MTARRHPDPAERAVALLRSMGATMRRVERPSLDDHTLDVVAAWLLLIAEDFRGPFTPEAEPLMTALREHTETLSRWMPALRTAYDAGRLDERVRKLRTEGGAR